jgi:selenide,water dikinase
LADALAGLPPSVHPNLLVGFNKADDAGVYRLDDKTALVQTVDFFPPIVDDPYFFGQIAAANALSDIYAMGGRPITALNIVGFPSSTMPGSILADILRGGMEKIEEAGAVVVGGHSIKDKELKYGVAVTGLIDPSQVKTNDAARPGDLLFLTKPLGTGIITTGIKNKVVEPSLVDLVVRQMASLNRGAAEAVQSCDAHAVTDITGFGLLGHGFEMASASRVTLRLYAGAVPILPEAVRLAGQGMNPGGANDNRKYLEGHVRIEGQLDSDLEKVFYDPQTSGGLLIAVAAECAADVAAALKDQGLPHEVIGRVENPSDHELVIDSK